MINLCDDAPTVAFGLAAARNPRPMPVPVVIDLRDAADTDSEHRWVESDSTNYLRIPSEGAIVDDHRAFSVPCAVAVPRSSAQDRHEYDTKQLRGLAESYSNKANARAAGPGTGTHAEALTSFCALTGCDPNWYIKPQAVI